MTEPGKRVNVRIPAQLYSEIEKSEMTVTEAIVQGLETIFKKAVSVSLEDIIKLKDEALISSQSRITSLEDQLKVKDEQLSTRDKQIEKINETMNAQSVHIQTLINQKAIEAPGDKKKWFEFWK